MPYGANDQVDVERNCITEEGASLLKTFLESSPHANALDNKIVNPDDDDDRQANALGNIAINPDNVDDRHANTFDSNAINFDGGNDRTIPSFYREVKWFDWVAIYLESDSTENRLLLRRWVYEPKQPSSTLYGFIKKSVTNYLEKIQELMEGDHMYYVRRQVNTPQR